jgi:hypothetical protein
MAKELAAPLVSIHQNPDHHPEGGVGCNLEGSKRTKRKAKVSSGLTKEQGYINGFVPPPPLHLCIPPLMMWPSFFLFFGSKKI